MHSPALTQGGPRRQPEAFIVMQEILLTKVSFLRETRNPDFYGNASDG